MVVGKGGRVMRKLGVVVVALALLVGGGLYYLANSIDGIVANLIEKSGSVSARIGCKNLAEGSQGIHCGLDRS